MSDNDPTVEELQQLTDAAAQEPLDDPAHIAQAARDYAATYYVEDDEEEQK